MYKNFFGLQTNPFGTSPDPRYLFTMPHTREALACLEYGISARKGFTVLTGEVGTGKTMLLHCALSSLRQQRSSTAFVFNPRLNVLEFFEFVLNDFGIVPSTRTKSGMLLQLNCWLVERFAANETCVLVIDEAQNLSWELLEEIRLLTNLETSSDKLLQIVLSGQPELEENLHHPSLRQLRQRVSLWCRTQPLTSSQTHGYVAQRLLISGANSPLFSSVSLDLVHRYSGGIPRLINLLCEHALLAAYVEQAPQVSEQIVETVAAELDLTPRRRTASSSIIVSGQLSPPMQADANGHVDTTAASETHPGLRAMVYTQAADLTPKTFGVSYTQYSPSLHQSFAEAGSSCRFDEGEQFRLMDRAHLPEQSASPKQIIFLAMGMAAGLGLRLLVIALAEYLDTSARSERDGFCRHAPAQANSNRRHTGQTTEALQAKGVGSQCKTKDQSQSASGYGGLGIYTKLSGRRTKAPCVTHALAIHDAAHAWSAPLLTAKRIDPEDSRTQPGESDSLIHNNSLAQAATSRFFAQRGQTPVDSTIECPGLSFAEATRRDKS